MTSPIGDVLLVLRRAAGMTQEELADRGGITQAALSRYENNMREPDDETAERLAAALKVTPRFLRNDFRMRGAVAADAHMRRQRTAKPSEWKRAEAKVNELRMHSTFLLKRVQLHPTHHVLQADPLDTPPQDAARQQRAAWNMPIGPVRDLTAWIESAGVIVVEQDLATTRIDGMSQWAGDHAIILLNAHAPTDRKRLTLAHELGHLVMHSNHQDEDVEEQANAFAGEFLMPEHIIRPQLRTLTLGKLADLKQEWQVSMQALIERAFHLGRLTANQRTTLYKQMTHRGWRKNEPDSARLPPETPRLAGSVGRSLADAGLTDEEIHVLVGVADNKTSPFIPPPEGLHPVPNH